MKRFKRQSDLIKHAVKGVLDRQAIARKKARDQMAKAGDFLQQCAMKLRSTR